MGGCIKKVGRYELVAGNRDVNLNDALNSIIDEPLVELEFNQVKSNEQAEGRDDINTNTVFNEPSICSTVDDTSADIGSNSYGTSAEMNPDSSFMSGLSSRSFVDSPIGFFENSLSTISVDLSFDSLGGFESDSKISRIEDSPKKKSIHESLMLYVDSMAEDLETLSLLHMAAIIEPENTHRISTMLPNSDLFVSSVSVKDVEKVKSPFYNGIDLFEAPKSVYQTPKSNLQSKKPFLEPKKVIKY